jgi:type II secretory pathway component GspD/PulD (secretin)
MSRTSWCLTIGALLALGGAARADDGPCKAPVSRESRVVSKDQAENVNTDTRSEVERKIEQRLLQHFDLSWRDTPLRQVIDDLHQMAQVNVVADTDALQEAGVSMEELLSLKVEDMSLKSALNILLKQARLTYVIKDEALQITTEEAARGKLKMVTYQVADLILPIGGGDGELPPFLCRKYPELAGKRAPGTTAEEALIRLITQTVEPSSWSEVGGKGTIQYYPLGLALVVNQTQDVQEQIADLLDALKREQENEDREYTVETRIFQKVPGDEIITQLPRVTFVRAQPITLKVCDDVNIRDGSIYDFAGDFTSGRFAKCEPETVSAGITLRLKVTAAEGGRLRLDANLRLSELVEATRDGLQINEKNCRFIRRVESGKPVRVVLSEDEHGKVQSWMFVTVTELPVEEPEEQIYTGCLPPIPR